MELSGCVVDPAQRPKGDGIIVAATRVWVRRREFALKALNSLLELVESKIRDAQIKINFRILWRTGKNLLEMSDGVVELEFGLFEDAQSLEDFGIIRRNPQALLVNALCAGVVSCLLVNARPL